MTPDPGPPVKVNDAELVALPSGCLPPGVSRRETPFVPELHQFLHRAMAHRGGTGLRCRSRTLRKLGSVRLVGKPAVAVSRRPSSRERASAPSGKRPAPASCGRANGPQGR